MKTRENADFAAKHYEYRKYKGFFAIHAKSQTKKRIVPISTCLTFKVGLTLLKINHLLARKSRLHGELQCP